MISCQMTFTNGRSQWYCSTHNRLGDSHGCTQGMRERIAELEEERKQLTDMLEDEIGGMPESLPTTNDEIIAAVRLLRDQCQSAEQDAKDVREHLDKSSHS